MTRSFSKNTSYSQFKLTALCLSLAIGWAIHGAPSLADDADQIATTEIMAMAHIC